MMYLGDFAPGAVIRFMWNSADSNGASITRSTNGTISVYKDGGTTQDTGDITDTEDFDGLTGVHLCVIDTGPDTTFYTAGSDYAVVLSAATIDTRTVNAVLAHFSLRNRAALMPTTAGRTLDVSAGGEAGVDWANVGSPTTTVGLTGTTVKTATDVETDTADIQSRLPAALVSGRIDASVGAMAANVITAAATAADFTTEVTSGLATAAALDAVDNFIDTEVAAIKAVTDLLPDGGALTSLATQASVNTIDDFLDTEIAAIKAKTDSLTFTVAGQVDANVQSINDVTITGNGQTGTEFGV